jgi:hypothetical protein
MSVTRQDVAAAFALLDATGCKRSKAMATDDGLAMALSTWPIVLSDLDRESLLALTIAYVRSASSAWFPTPGELLALRSEDGLDDALEQWGRLLRLLAVKGRARPPVPLVEAGRSPAGGWCLSMELEQDRAMRAGVAAVGGWRLACLMQDRDLPTNRAAFRDAYRGALRRGVRRAEVDEIGRITEGPARLLLGIG